MPQTAPRPRSKQPLVLPFIVPPGEILEEKINEQGWSLEEFADKVEMSIEAVVQLVKGRLPLSEAIAMKLESATDIPADYWNRAEQSYRSKLNQLENR